MKLKIDQGLKGLKSYLRSSPNDLFLRCMAEKYRFIVRWKFGIFEQAFFLFALWLEFAVTLVLEIMQLYHSSNRCDFTLKWIHRGVKCVKILILLVGNIIGVFMDDGAQKGLGRVYLKNPSCFVFENELIRRVSMKYYVSHQFKRDLFKAHIPTLVISLVTVYLQHYLRSYHHLAE